MSIYHLFTLEVYSLSKFSLTLCKYESSHSPEDDMNVAIATEQSLYVSEKAD